MASLDLVTNIFLLIIVIAVPCLILYLLFQPKYIKFLKPPRSVQQINSYFALYKPFWFQNIIHHKYKPMRYIHILLKNETRCEIQRLSKYEILRRLCKNGSGLIDKLSADYYYVAFTHDEFEKRLKRLECDGKIEILQSRKLFLKLPFDCTEKAFWSKARKHCQWKKYYTVIFRLKSQ